MGLVQGSLKALLTSQRDYAKCVPRKPYQPFPEHLHEPGEGGLVLEVQALPSRLARNEIPQDTFWWVDAQFLPYNDAELAVTSAAYTPRQAHAWTTIKRVPQGRILIFDTAHSPIKGYILTGTESSVYPKVQSHPLGEAVGYAGTGEVRVESLMNETVYSRPRDLDNRSHRFCAISPNGVNLAVLSRARGFYYLEIFQMDTHFVTFAKPIPCHHLCPGFHASHSHNDHVECKWSPDGSHVAVSSSNGQLFLVNRARSVKIASIFSDFVDGNLSTAGSFDFDPRVRFSAMAVGTSENILAHINIDCSRQDQVCQQQVETEDMIDCVQYNQDGTRLAVSFRTFQVAVYSTGDLSIIHTIDMSGLCSHHKSMYENQRVPTVHRLSFSYDGRHLATSSCDGYVRVWAVPRLLTLQDWCRKRILQSVPILSIRKFSLPEKVKQFLLSEFF